MSQTCAQLCCSDRVVACARPLRSFVLSSPPPPLCRHCHHQNNLHELWALLNFLLPSVFKDSEAFSKVFDLNVDDADKKQNMIKQLHKILRYSSVTACSSSNNRADETAVFLSCRRWASYLVKASAVLPANQRPNPQHQPGCWLASHNAGSSSPSNP